MRFVFIWNIKENEVWHIRASFQFKKSFRSYWVLIQRPNAVYRDQIQTWHNLHKYAFKGRFLVNDAI